MIPERAQVILDFWFKETPSEMRFKKDEKFDQKIKDNFLEDYELACQNEYDDWQDNPMSCLALVILFDQFSRNMFRNDKKAFAQDQKTRLIVNDAMYQDWKHKKGIFDPPDPVCTSTFKEWSTSIKRSRI